MVGLLGVGAIARTCSGLWRYLIERVRGRTQVQLEQARSQGTVQVICVLPPGSELWESEPGGRTRVIRMPAPPTEGDGRTALELPPR
jgi:hypothetical protein